MPGKDNTVADCLSRCAFPAGKAQMDISMHGDAEETAQAKRIIEAERLLEDSEAKCSVVIGSRAELAQVRDTKVQAHRPNRRRRIWYQPLKECNRD